MRKKVKAGRTAPPASSAAVDAAAARTPRVFLNALHSMVGIVMTHALAKNDHIIRGMAFGICWSQTPAGTVAMESAVVAPRVLSIIQFIDGGYQFESVSKWRRTCFGVRMVICLDDDDNCTALKSIKIHAKHTIPSLNLSLACQDQFALTPPLGSPNRIE